MSARPGGIPRIRLRMRADIPGRSYGRRPLLVRTGAGVLVGRTGCAHGEPVTHRFRIEITASEPLIEKLMQRKKCSRRAALKDLRMAWVLEIENMEPCLDDSGIGPDPNEISFQSGGSEVR